MIHYRIMAISNQKVNLVFDADKWKLKEIIDTYELRENCRERSRLFKRQFLMWYIRENYKISLTKIGKFFDRDHATVINSCKAVQNAIDTKDKLYFNEVEVIRKELEKLKYEH